MRSITRTLAVVMITLMLIAGGINVNGTTDTMHNSVYAHSYYDESRIDEFNDFVEYMRQYSPLEFCYYWNAYEHRNFEINFWEGDMSWPEHKDDTAFEIYCSGKLNCHRMTTLLLYIYGGKYYYIDQPASFDHAIYIYGEPGNWKVITFPQNWGEYGNYYCDYIELKATTYAEMRAELEWYFWFENPQYVEYIIIDIEEDGGDI